MPSDTTVADRTDLADCHLADVCSSEIVTDTLQDDISGATANT
ncbi:hypothetical protein [Streptomyces sp. NPDC058294]